MTTQLSPTPVQKFFDNNGNPLANGQLFSYIAGTTTPQATYVDSTQVTQNTNPIILNARGECNLWLDPTLTYKLVLQDSLGNQIWSVNGINGALNPNSSIIPAVNNTYTLGSQAFSWGQLYVGANHAPLYFPLSGNLAYFELTAAERSAAVSPTDFSYQPGNVLRYGAKLDGVTDDHVAFQAADSQCSQGGAPIFIPRSTGGLATATPLTISYLSNLIMDAGAFILWTSTANSTALTIGSALVSQVAFSQRYERITVKRQTQADWTSEAAIGVKLLNMAGCWIDIAQINGFTLGMQILPQASAGFQDNDVHLGQIYNNKIGIDVSNATNGFANENNYFGGRITQFTGVNTTTTCYGVRITTSDGVYAQNNNNRFWGLGIDQLAATRTGGAFGYPVLIVNGVNNHFYDARDEANSSPFATEQNASSENTYEVGYASYVTPPAVSSSSTAQAWYVRSGRARQLDFARLLFDSGPVHDRACWYDGATAVHVPRCSIADSGSATAFTGLSLGSAPFVYDAAGRPKYLECSVGLRGIAIFVSCATIKQFVVTRDCDTSGLPTTSYGGEIDINCWDVTGSLITTAGSIVGTLYQPIVATANFGGGFHTTSDSNTDTFFTVANTSVAYLRICIVKSTNNLRIRSFRIYGVNAQGDAATWPGYQEVVPGANIGTQPPSSAVSGVWGVGRRVLQATPVVGSPKGWHCTVAGTPGTWVSEGNL